MFYFKLVPSQLFCFRFEDLFEDNLNLEKVSDLISNNDFNNDFMELVNKIWQFTRADKIRGSTLNIQSVALGKLAMPFLIEFLPMDALFDIYELLCKNW